MSAVAGILLAQERRMVNRLRTAGTENLLIFFPGPRGIVKLMRSVEMLLATDEYHLEKRQTQLADRQQI